MAQNIGEPAGVHLRQPGMIESVRLAYRAFMEYAMVRFELAGLESRDALQKVLKALIASVVALLCLLGGLFYLSLSLVYVLAEKAGWGWGWALLASGVAMLIVTAAGLLLAKNSLMGSWFPATITELKKDSEWLKKTPTPTV
ncbi:MAG TPA: phage holin family protein [Chthoniobacterales bacterium]|jgi:uncharacterized membrane protein YqjE